ncbi:TPA: DUF2188 domain-containing protein [Legionella pneumophila]
MLSNIQMAGLLKGEGNSKATRVTSTQKEAIKIAEKIAHAQQSHPWGQALNFELQPRANKNRYNSQFKA